MDDLTINNIAEQLEGRLQGTFRWKLLSELLRRLESVGKNTKDLVGVNTWFKEELTKVVKSDHLRNSDPRQVLVAQSILDLIKIRSNFTSKSQEEIFIYTSPYVENGTFLIQKGTELKNKKHFSFDICMNLPYYKCNSATALMVDEAINSKILRFSNLFTDFCRSRNIECDLKPLRNNSDTDVTVYGRIGADGESLIDQMNVTLQGSTTLDMGLKVQLQNLHQIDELCIFPGQMASVTGTFFEDNFGMKYITSEISEFRYYNNYLGCGIPVEKPMVTMSSQKKFMGENIHIVAVKGALLTEDLQQTSFGIFREFNYYSVDIFQKIKRDRPHVVFFTGPFVSVNQMPVEGYDLGKLGDMTFLYTKFLTDLSNLAESSWDILFLNHLLTVNQLGYIIKCIQKIPPEKELKMVCQQILMQWSFFPSYPASKLPAEYAIDHTKLRELEFSSDMVPDVLLFCSSLKVEPFIEFTNQRAFVSFHNGSRPPKDSLVNSITEIYITPKIDDDESQGVIQDLDIENRITVSYTLLK